MKNSLLRAIISCLFALALGASTSLLAQTSPFVGQDVGTPGHPGGITNNVNGTMSINGGGDDIWNNADNFFYYYTSVTGLVWEAKMKVVSFTGPDFWSKIELMTRRADPSVGTPQGPDPELNITMTQTLQQNEVRGAWRGTRGGGSGDTGGTGIIPAYPNQWVRITRVNNVFTLSRGTDGVNWTPIATQDTATTANGFDGVAWENPIEVGAAITAHNNGDANGATAVISNLTVTLVPPPTAAGVVTQLQSTATFQYTEASFTFVATNNANPNILDMDYAWYKNNQLVSTNRMGPRYTFLTTPADNGASVYAIATVPPPYNTLSVTSAVVTLTVNPPSSIYTNGLKREFFAGGTRQNVEIGSIGRATSVSLVSAAQLPGGFGDNYSDRFSGYFIPPTTAAYVFFVAADDDTDVYLSTDSNPTNKALIAQEPGWSPNLSWLVSGSNGALDVQQRRSDQWSPDPLSLPAANPNGFYLTQGNLYYLEMVHHNGGGGDNFAVTYQTTNQIADPNWPLLFTNGSASLLNATNNNIALITSPITTLSWTLQPTNLTVFEGQAANFFSKAVSDSELAVQYQWYTVAPSAPIAGATGPTLVIPVAPSSYNGLQGYCVAKTAVGGLSITSSVATLTVLQSVFEPGWALVQWWDSSAPSRVTIEAGSAPPPQHTFASPRFESAINGAGDNYANRLIGYFVPPATGDYVFFMNSDDDADLFLSTDNTPGNKRLIAAEAGWAGNSGLGWTLTGGGGDSLAQRRSDQFTDPATGTQPYSTGIHMLAGQRYYMEGVHKEGGGGDYFAVTSKLFAGPDPVNGDDSTLVGNAIGLFTPRIPWVAFLQQPASQSAASGGNSVTFTARGYSAPSIMPGTTGDPRPLFLLSPTNVTYQWYRNATPIPGATASSYTLVPIRPSDGGAQFVCGIRALGYADNSLNPIFSNSVPAVLTVVTDTVPPTISYAATLQNTNPLSPLFIVDITFSEWMDATTLTNLANYSVAGATITNIVLAPNHRTVELDLNQMPTLPLSVTVNGVKDISGNTIALNSSAPINPVGLTCTDIGILGADPAYPSFITVTASGGYIVKAEGSDIWANADGFNFTWELKTNDFDAVVRGVSTTHTSQWAKMGLMVRESLDSNSRNWNIVNDPASADGIAAPDGSGFGANDTECNMRDTTAVASGGWRNLAGGNVPAYPNAWVRLKRTGNLLEASRSVNGLTWTRLAAYDTGTNVNGALPGVAYVGLCTTAHNNDQPGLDPNVGPFLYYNTVEYANYTSTYVAPAQLTAVVSGANIIVSWNPAVGHLEASPAISGPGVNWQTVVSGNPATIPIAPGARFFRVVNP